jgi:hypothetical protein
MDGQRTYDDLSDEQKARFGAVINKLEKLDVPELLLESARLRMPKPMTEDLKPRFRSNFAGAIAAQKVIAYLDELNSANELWRDLGEKIMRLNAEANTL